MFLIHSTNQPSSRFVVSLVLFSLFDLQNKAHEQKKTLIKLIGLLCLSRPLLNMFSLKFYPQIHVKKEELEYYPIKKEEYLDDSMGELCDDLFYDLIFALLLLSCWYNDELLLIHAKFPSYLTM